MAHLNPEDEVMYMTILKVHRRAGAAIVMAAALAACDGQPSAPTQEDASGDLPGALSQNGTIIKGRFIVCKTGSSADFTYTVETSTDGVTYGAAQTFTLHLEDGQCQEVANADAYARVTVTETAAQTGYEFNRVAWRTTGDANFTPVVTILHTPTVTAVSSSANTTTGLRQQRFTFINLPDDDIPPPPPPPSLTGRMTGGGNLELGDVKITRGFTIHCDLVLSNNIQINWGQNRWHLDKPITSAHCLDDPAHDEEHPVAGFDTFIGAGVGRLNGVDGSRLEFIFIDSGEPGGRNDIAGIQIWDAANNLVLDVPAQFLTHGNLQAHEDQPHRNK